MPNDHSESIYCDELVWLQHDIGPFVVTYGNCNLPRPQHQDSGRCFNFRTRLAVRTCCSRSKYGEIQAVTKTEHVLLKKFNRCQTCWRAIYMPQNKTRNDQRQRQTEHPPTTQALYALAQRHIIRHASSDFRPKRSQVGRGLQE